MDDKNKSFSFQTPQKKENFFFFFFLKIKQCNFFKENKKIKNDIFKKKKSKIKQFKTNQRKQRKQNNDIKIKYSHTFIAFAIPDVGSKIRITISVAISVADNNSFIEGPLLSAIF